MKIFNRSNAKEQAQAQSSSKKAAEKTEKKNNVKLDTFAGKAAAVAVGVSVMGIKQAQAACPPTVLCVPGQPAPQGNKCFNPLGYNPNTCKPYAVCQWPHPAPQGFECKTPWPQPVVM